jgi:hypothetical protein
MAGHVVDGRAHALGEAHVVEGRRVRVVADDELMQLLVDCIRGRPFLDQGLGMVEDLAAQLARGADFVNLLGSVDRDLALLCGRRG